MESTSQGTDSCQELEFKSFESLAQLEVGICRQILQNPKQMQLHTDAVWLEEASNHTERTCKMQPVAG